MIIFGLSLMIMGILMMFDADMAASATVSSLDPELFKQVLNLYNSKVPNQNNIKQILDFVRLVGDVEAQYHKIPQMLQIVPQLIEDEKLLAWNYISGIKTEMWHSTNGNAPLNEIKAYFKEIKEETAQEFTQSLCNNNNHPSKTSVYSKVITAGLIGVSLALIQVAYHISIPQ